MSVINRMLADLERRGGHTAVGAPDLRPARSAARSGPRGRRLATLALALALVAVASLLWLQRGPAIADHLRVAVAGPGVDAPAAMVAYRPDPEPAAADAQESGAAVADDPLDVTLSGLRFDIEGEHEAALVLEFTGEPPPMSLPAVEDGVLSLRVAADAGGVSVPSPPGGQALFRSLSVQTGSAGSKLDLELAGNTRVGLERGDNTSLRLAARGPGVAVDDSVAVAPVTVIEPESTASDAADAADATAEADTETRAETGTATDAATAAGDEPDSAVELEAIQVVDEAGGSIRSDDRASDEVLARRRFGDARDALAAGDTRRARRLLEEAVELDADLHSARDVLVTLLRRAGDVGGARRILVEGLERAPARASFAKPHARMLVDDGEYARARDTLEAARINAEGDLEFHALLANIHRRLGDHGPAIAEYTEALEIDSNQASLWLGLGISLAADGHDQQAGAAFREARATRQLSERLDRWAEQKIEELERSGGGG